MTENNAAHQDYLEAHRAVRDVLAANAVYFGGNTINAIVDAVLSKLRAPVADERAVETFAERFALALKPVAYTTKRGAVYRGKSTQVGSENLCTISQAVYEFRAALASLPAPDERQAVAYLDLGTGGYMDMGTDLTDEQLAALPKGRHMLAIIGSHGVNGYSPCALESAPVADERAAQEYGSPADVAQRIEQYLAQDGRMNSGTQLLYEAMKALRASQGNRNDR
ncbi:hypothetical protein ACOTEH_23760 [Achromobacter xylosoxidans]